MSDRAANEKKSNRLLSEWRTDLLGKDCTPVQDFFCMAHVLLGFQADCLKHLKSVQEKLAPEGKMGRDRVKGYKIFKKDQATSRMCSAVSNVFGPVGEHFGVREKWEAFCEKEGVVSTVQNFKDNRFNGLFALAASTCLHREHFLHVLSLVEEPKKKLAALKEDLRDQDLMNLILGLRIMYLKVTRPFWDMITSPKTTYLELGPTIKKLLDEFEKAGGKPEIILLENSFPSLGKYRNATRFEKNNPQAAYSMSLACPVGTLQSFLFDHESSVSRFLKPECHSRSH
ncbi:hypothetical protein k02a2.6-like [Plakobranchus ocellatus]|uniref:Uncharacterized protein n=1 Tax=Plakobranchus ocellatus TaxID=259542 RepID=A0AAV4B351_9GAST|nr:hypothetical protein k02a2.6-like [Plakobranchus ocellatus]